MDEVTTYFRGTTRIWHMQAEGKEPGQSLCGRWLAPYRHLHHANWVSPELVCKHCLSKDRKLHD